MGFRDVFRRARAVIGFFLLLMVCAAAPGLAEDPPADPQVPASEGADPERLPSAADVTAGIEKAEEEEAQWQQWLASPAAIEERQASRAAFAGLAPAAAEELLSETFGEQLQNLNSDPARYLSDAQLLSASEDETAGTVKEDGDSALLDAEIPLRTEDEDGELRKVDLSLEATADGFETANALVDVDIPDSAAGEIEVGADDLGISQQGAAPERDARRFGDENAFYPNVLPDTDMLVSPVSGGVEIFNQLRSEDSPETFRFEVDVPVGATLQANGDWGAKVVSGGDLIAMVPQPTAVDAQGKDVPVEMTVDGHSLVLEVDHRDGDYAMPILLDPILENNENWIYGQNHNALDQKLWTYHNGNNTWAWFRGSTYCIYECFGPGGKTTRGLFVSSEGQRWLGASQFGHWAYGAPNVHSYIKNVTLGAPYVREDHGCSAGQYPQPHDYFGVWSANQEAWVYLSVGSANYPGGHYTLPFSGDAVISGLGSGGGGFFMPCARDLYAGGAHVWLDDWNHPWIEGGLQGIQGIPSKWVSNETPFTITAIAKDEGLGIKNVRIHQNGSETIYDVPVQNECSGTRRSLCYTTHTASFDNIHGGHFSQGERDTWLSANDAVGKYTGDHHWTMRVDNTPPEITLGGEFAEETSEVGSEEKEAGKGDVLSLPVYNLTVKAKDGSLGNPLDKRSGVKDIEIWLDGVEQPVPWEPQSCPNSSCSMEKIYSVKLSKLTTSGDHVLKVVATDQVGKRLKREIEFKYFPATGMKDEYVMHYFPLPDGQGNEAEEEHPDRPELAVNVMNGNLVYRETDIDVEGTAALDLEVERYYNSMLPENEETEWGDGWTLAQTPELDPVKAGGSPVPNEAEILDSSGAFEAEVVLPTEAGAEKFDPALQATLTKKASGGYELTDETGEEPGSLSFDATGQTEALLDDGYAKVDYEYEAGELAEIEVSDPATFSADPAELEIPEPELITAPAFADSFGSNGSADGQFKSPGGVAVDAQGNLWVVDRVNNRIQKFDSTGKFLAKFGSLGSGDGQFNRPTAIAIAANGDLLVTDAGNGRIQRFSPAGAFISKFGSKGTGNGQFGGAGPEGIAIDAAGNIWVTDTYGGRIQKFSSAGAFLQSVGTKGSAPGQLGEPTGIDIDSSGKVWVADWQNHRVSTFNAAGEFISSFGSMGTADGQFKNPDAIEVDNLGNVWVGDQSNHRVQQFDLTGQFKAKFGAAGSGPGQFNFSYPMDIAADSKGNLWVTDVNNHRVQHWLVPVERPAYVRKFGSAGSGDGQLAAPSDLVVGVEGNLLVVDRVNNRIQRFDKSGKYLGKFGSGGSGQGQFSRPTAIAADRDGNLLVADSSNNRVQKLSPDGQFISKFGSAGAGNSQFSGPEGVAADFDGNVWVADSGNGRIQKFNEEGEFLGVVSSKGSEPGQLGKPVGIEVDPEGRVWITDWLYNRVAVFEADGDFVGQFGTQGSGPGQFYRPTGIEIDAHGNVWVVDHGYGRIQRFDLDGVYVGQFGSSGSGEGQFSLPVLFARAGITSDRSGRIWVSDVGNNRIQQWMLGHYEAEVPAQLDLSDGDPKVEVQTEGDLVTSVSGNAAGTHSYEHDGDFLTSHSGPEGETAYEKNSAGLLSKVTLPNGAWASIAYYADKRVQAVTVAADGTNTKTTHFHYQDGPPRRSFVTPPDKPQLTYDIAADGSVLNWWHKQQKPEFLALNGSLAVEKGKEVSAGDLVLEVIADSPHGISSIQVIANGNQLVSEKKCEQNLETPEIECTREEDLWVTDTSSLAPGILNMEVIVADRFGDSESERWWVKIPHTPPPVPGYPQAPKFSEIQKFREDYGLEVVFPVANEREQVERIFNLINAWHSPHTPAGEVARASWERWGVPLRPQDVAEMHYRENYLQHFATSVPSWAGTHAISTYAGYYVNHKEGGLVYLRFTTDANSSTDALRASGIPASDRVRPSPALADYPLSSLASLVKAIAPHQATATITELSIDEEQNHLHAKAINVNTAKNWLASHVGSNAPVTVGQDEGWRLVSKRWTRTGPVFDGQAFGHYLKVNGEDGRSLCTVGAGATERGKQKVNGEWPYRQFALTAGHCFDTGKTVGRWSNIEDFDPPTPIGEVARRPFENTDELFRTDVEAVRLDEGLFAPRHISRGDSAPLAVGGSTRPAKGMPICTSGAKSDRVRDGELRSTIIVQIPKTYNEYNEPKTWWAPTYQVHAQLRALPGDSGGPVWRCGTGQLVGLITASSERGDNAGISTFFPPEPPEEPQTLLPFEPEHAPGILNVEGLEDINLAFAK